VTIKEDNMKKRYIKIMVLPFLMVLIYLSTPQFAAASDICVFGSSAVHMNVKETDKLFEEKIDGHPISGSGTVTSVVQPNDDDMDESVTVKARCSSGVNLVLNVDISWVRRNNAREGSMVRFNGKCVRLQKSGSTVTCIIHVN
jgi:hypothetical protein